MHDEKFWNQIPQWDAVGKACEDLLAAIDSDDDFQASLSALYAALDKVRVNGEVCHDHIFELDSLPPGSGPAYYRPTVEDIRDKAIWMKKMVRRAALWTTPSYCPVKKV
jgi:hypothetical protein